MNNPRRALTLLVAVFLAGCLVGAGIDHLLGRRIATRGGDVQRSGRAGGTDRLVAVLQLTPDQQVQLKAIYEELRQQIDSIRREMGGRFEAVRARANERIASMLTPEQKRKFEEYSKEDRSRQEPYHGGADGGERRSRSRQ